MRWFACLLLAASTAAFAQSSISVMGGGVSVHGESIDPELAQRMPHRLTDDGHIVYHSTEVSVTYNTGIWQTNALYFKDSFNNDAVYIGSGVAIAFPFDNLMLGATAGLYSRRIEKFRDDTGEVRIDSGFVLISTSTIEVLPMMFATAAWTKPIQGRLNFVLAGATNLALTHITAGLQYRIE